MWFLPVDQRPSQRLSITPPRVFVLRRPARRSSYLRIRSASRCVPVHELLRAFYALPLHPICWHVLLVFHRSCSLTKHKRGRLKDARTRSDRESKPRHIEFLGFLSLCFRCSFRMMQRSAEVALLFRPSLSHENSVGTVFRNHRDVCSILQARVLELRQVHNTWRTRPSTCILPAPCTRHQRFQHTIRLN